MCDSCLWNACYLADLTPSGILLSLGLLQTGLWSRADEHRELLYKQWFMGHKHSFILSFTIPIWYLHIVDMKYNIYMSKTMFVSLSSGKDPTSRVNYGGSRCPRSAEDHETVQRRSEEMKFLFTRNIKQVSDMNNLVGWISEDMLRWMIFSIMGSLQWPFHHCLAWYVDSI